MAAREYMPTKAFCVSDTILLSFRYLWRPQVSTRQAAVASSTTNGDVQGLDARERTQGAVVDAGDVVAVQGPARPRVLSVRKRKAAMRKRCTGLGWRPGSTARPTRTSRRSLWRHTRR